MSYQYITNRDSPNFTPVSQTRNVWGVDRKIKNIAIHWWGDPAQNPQFAGIVDHLCDPNSAVSAHYVATGTGRQVACLVAPEDNSWSTMSDNPYCISIECDPRCRDEDYDVVAELIADIRSAYGDFPLVPHRQYTATTCPGNWDLARLDALARTKFSATEWGQGGDIAPVTTTTTTEVQSVPTTTTTTVPPAPITPSQPSTTTTTTTTAVLPTSHDESGTTTTTSTTTPGPEAQKATIWGVVVAILIAILKRLQGVQ